MQDVQNAFDFTIFPFLEHIDSHWSGIRSSLHHLPRSWQDDETINAGIVDFALQFFTFCYGHPEMMSAYCIVISVNHNLATH